MSQTQQSSWSIKRPATASEVVIEGVHQDIPQIVDAILDPSSELGKLSRTSTIFILKVRGFSLLALREEFKNRGKGLLEDLYLPVQASFNVEKKWYVVEFTDRDNVYPKGQILEG